MSTFTSSLGLEEIAPGTQAGLWGDSTNNNLNLIDQAVTGVTPLSFAGLSGTVRVLESSNGAEDEARSAVLDITGGATGANTVVVPNKQKTYLVRNATGQSIVFRTASPAATFTLDAGNSLLIFCDGANNVLTGIASPSVGTLGVSAGGTGNTTFTAGFIKSTGGTNALTSAGGVNLASADVSGTLPVANGGTGVASFAAGHVLTGNGTGPIGSINAGVSGQALVSNGSGYAPTNTVNTINQGTGIQITGSAGNFTISASGSTGGTVTSVSGTGSGLGFSLSGTVTSSGSITFSAPTAATLNSNLGAATLSGAQTFTSGLKTFSTTAGISMISPLFDGQTISSNFGAFSTGLHPTGLQIGVSGAGIIRSTINGRMEFLSPPYGVSAFFQTDGNNLQGNNSPSWASISDQNIKTNLRPISDVLGKINALKPCHFDYKDKIGETRTGFIAQEFATVFPGHTIKSDVDEKYKEFVPEGVTELLGIDMNLTAYLVKAIQELSAKVDAQAAEIAALKAQ